MFQRLQIKFQNATYFSGSYTVDKTGLLKACFTECDADFPTRIDDFMDDLW